MFKQFVKRINDKTNKGFSLVELVVAMSILLIIMPATVGIMKSATTYKNQTIQSNKNLVQSSSFNTVFRSDIENAVSIKIEPGTGSIPEGNYLKLKIAKKSSTGSISYVCKSWIKGKGSSGLLKSRSINNTSIPTPDTAVDPKTKDSDWNKNWSDVFDGSVANVGSSGKMFTYENGSVTYNFKLGEKKVVNEYSGTITPKSSQISSSPCW